MISELFLDSRNEAQLVYSFIQSQMDIFIYLFYIFYFALFQLFYSILFHLLSFFDDQNFLLLFFIYFVTICPVPGCSGMFRNVPGCSECSVFRVLLTSFCVHDKFSVSPPINKHSEIVIFFYF